MQISLPTPTPTAGLNLLTVSSAGTTAVSNPVINSNVATPTIVATPDGKTATVLNAASPLTNIQLVNASGAANQTWPAILPITYIPSNPGGGAIISPQLVAASSASTIMGTGGGARMPVFTTPNTIMAGLNAGTQTRLAPGNIAQFIAINPMGGVSALGGAGQAATIPMIIQLPAQASKTESS